MLNRTVIRTKLESEHIAVLFQGILKFADVLLPDQNQIALGTDNQPAQTLVGGQQADQFGVVRGQAEVLVRRAIGHQRIAMPQ